MEVIRNLIARLRHTGVLFLIGILLIVYIAFGVLYLQQGPQQRELEEKIAKLTLVASRPVAGADELRAEYEKVNHALTPMSASEAIAELVDIADKNGIDVRQDGGKFRVSSAKFGQIRVGGGTYRLVSFRDIYVQGDPDDVMDFISDLDSGKTLESMVLRKIVTNEKEVPFSGSEAARRAEFREVEAAVKAMMINNNLQVIPRPMYFKGGVATNLMGDDPDTAGAVEGFPDILTPAVERGYSGNATPRDGYVLYNHDRISTANTTQFETVNYIHRLTTEYYYTCEADGTVRQFSGINVATAMEYPDSISYKTELVVLVDVDIYTKP